MNKSILIICSLLAATLSAKASLYRNYQTEDGLSHNSVWAAMQDSQGFLWLGTNDGLNRFDGMHFKVFRRKEGDTLSLGNNFIHCLLELNDASMLVGTKEGLYCYNRSDETFRHIILDGKPFGEDRTSIHSLLADKHGNVWVGCYGQGIYCLDGKLNVKRHYLQSLPTPYINVLALDLGGNIWAGTDGKGLFKLVAKTGSTLPSPISSGIVQSLCCDNNNTLWVGTSTEGLYHYDIRGNTAKRLLSLGHAGRGSQGVFNIKAITPFSQNELVMGSEHGLLKLDIQTETLAPFNEGTSYDNLPDNSIFAICKDDEGGLWIGTYFCGVGYWSPRINNFNYFMAGDNHANGIVNCIEQDGNNTIWLATRNRGLVAYDPLTLNTRDILTEGSPTNIQAMLIDGQTLLFNDYNKGLAVYDIPSARRQRLYTVADGLPSDVVNFFFKSSRGDIYIGTTKGACRYVDGQLIPIPELKKASVMCIIEDYNGNIWFATHFYGLFCITTEGKCINLTHKADDRQSLVGSNLNSLCLDRKGNVWVGTEGEGLQVLDTKSLRFIRRLTQAEGLPSNIIYSIETDNEGNIWASTGGGLVKIAADSYAIHTFSYIEQLLKMHYLHNSSLMSHDGTLYFGGSNGFISFRPENTNEPQDPPRVVVTDFYVNGKRIMPNGDDKLLTANIASTRKIILQHSQRTFSFDVACLSYVAPQQVTIAYRLEGYDRQWQYLTDGQRHILYMNLPAGKYRLLVKATKQSIAADDDTTIWSDVVTLDIQVRPPFLLSQTMIVFYILAALAVLFYLQRRYRRRLEAANKERMLKFSIDKEKELYEAKIGFFTNIAHEIRTPLSLISAPLEQIITQVSPLTAHPSPLQKNLNIIKSNVNRLLELVNQLLDFQKVESRLMKLTIVSEDVSQLTIDACSRYEEFARLHDITLDTSAISPGIHATIDREAFRKIVGNLLSNALKFAKSNVAVRLYTRDDRFVVEVADDGPGIKSEQQEKIFETFYQIDDNGKYPGSGLGLPLARSLAQMHNGSLTVVSQYTQGSTFVLAIPLQEVPADDADGTEPVGSPDSNPADEDALRLLIVEDNAELRSFIADNIGADISVVQAENGIKALEQLERHSIDIIVSDIMMPEMDGLQLCQALRRSEAFNHIPVVILSAKTDIPTKVDGLSIGADAYLEKPFSLEQLRAQVLAIINARKRLQEKFIQQPLDFYTKPQKDDNHEEENRRFVEQLNTLILDNLTNDAFNIDGLARQFLMSRSNFHKRVKAITGKTPNDYIRIVRLNKSLQLLATGKYQVVEVCYMVGFNTPSYFSKCFYELFHKLPKDYLAEKKE